MIIRTPGRERFLILSKVPLEDTRLSWKARGLHAYLMSKPDSWSVLVAHLVNQGPDGKDSVMSGLRELEGAGYIRRTRRRNQPGKYDGIDYEVFEESTTGLSTCGKPSRGKPATSEERELLNKDLVNKESEISNSDPVDLAAVRAKNDAIFKRTRPSGVSA